MMNIPANYWWFYPLIIIDLVLKGFALWTTAQRKEKYWFIALLVINSAGILPLIYLLFFTKGETVALLKKKLIKKSR